MAEQKQTTEVSKVHQSPSQRFTTLAMREFTTSVGALEVTEKMRRLLQNYYVMADTAIHAAEDKRGTNNNATPYIWANVNLDNKLFQTIFIFAKMGIDPSVPNMLFPVLRKNGKNEKYDICWQEGFAGRMWKTMKYASGTLLDITVELIYKNDEFKVIKKGFNNKVENYEFNIPSPFDRGPLVGAFGYLHYADESMNKVITITQADINKRKAKALTQAFWNNWPDEMAYKTAVNIVCKKVAIDPDKIDDAYNKAEMIDRDNEEAEMKTVINENANTELIDIPESVVIAEETETVSTQEQKITPPKNDSVNITPGF